MKHRQYKKPIEPDKELLDYPTGPINELADAE
jgi:hypothetical protein